MKVITTGLLNRFWTKGIKPWLDKRIKSYTDLMVTTASGYTPDALAVKEGFTELNGKLVTTYGFASLVASVITTDYNQTDKALIVFDLKLDEVSRYSIEIWKSQIIVWYIKNATWNKVAAYVISY